MREPPPTTVADPDVVARVLARLPAATAAATRPSPGASLRVEPLAGGYHNTVVRVRDGEAVDWVVKQYVVGSTNPLYPQLHDHEALALEVFASRRVAPVLVGYLPDAEVGPVVVYEFVEGAMWDGDVAAAAAVLARAHVTVVPEDAPFRRLAVTSDDVLDDAARMLVVSSPHHAAAIRRCARSVPAWVSDERALVHTDCGPGNMVTSEDGVRLIDWQCPGLGDPLEDLVVFTSPAMQILYGRPPLDDRARSIFLAAYADRSASGRDAVARLDRCAPAHHVRIAAYCAYRIVELAASAPDVAARYGRALSAELAWLAELLDLAPTTLTSDLADPAGSAPVPQEPA